MSDVVLEPPILEPVSIQEVRDDLRLGSVTDDDRMLVRNIRVAREWVERRIGMSMMTQTREAVWVVGNELLKGPVQEIVTQETDVDGVTTTVYVAGHATREEVPEPVKAAIRLKVQELYEGTDMTRQIDDLLINYATMVS